jgi:hypothetical protein
VLGVGGDDTGERCLVEGVGGKTTEHQPNPPNNRVPTLQKPRSHGKTKLNNSQPGRRNKHPAKFPRKRIITPSVQQFSCKTECKRKSAKFTKRRLIARNIS